MEEKWHERCLRSVTWKRSITAALVVTCLALVTAIIYKDQTDRNRSDPHKERLRRKANAEYHRKLVADVNADPNATWKAKFNPSADTATEIHTMRGIITMRRSQEIDYDQYIGLEELTMQGEETQRHQELLDNYTTPLPESFDGRDKWRHCWTVHHVPDQGGCGSCWAVAISSAMQDRICIHTNGKHQPQLSVEDLVSCCTDCGGCNGLVHTTKPYAYWQNEGLVTGGDYGSSSGCKPYKKSPACGHPCPISYYVKTNNGECHRSCNEFYGTSYKNDRYFGGEFYWTTDVLNTAKTLERMKKELFLFGPHSICFRITEHYQHYASGVFEDRDDYRTIYGHCNKVIGWGVENNRTYLTLMNTWGRNFGENGSREK